MSKFKTSGRDWKRVTGPRITGTVKWYNVKKGFGFIVRNDTKTDIFVHRTAISRNNQRKVMPSLADNEVVDFCVVTTEKGERAAAVSGPNGTRVQGSKFARKRRRRRSRNDPPRHSTCSDDPSRGLSVSIGTQTVVPEECVINGTTPRKTIVPQSEVVTFEQAVSNATGQNVKCREPKTVPELHQWLMDTLNVRKSGYPRVDKYAHLRTFFG